MLLLIVTRIYTEVLGKDGRGPKTRRQGVIDESIESVLKIKAAIPVPSSVIPSHVMKASHVVQGIATSNL